MSKRDSEQTPENPPTDLEKRIEFLEQTVLQAGNGAGRRSGRLSLMLVVVVIALLTVNAAFIKAHLDREADEAVQTAFWEICHPGLTASQRSERFVQLAADGNTEWQSAILDNLQLDQVDLSEMSIELARFTKCSFKDAKFVKAVMNGSGLDLSDFSNADFSSAKLRNTTFFKSTLVEANFRNAELLSTSLEQSKSQGAIFVAAKMGDAFLAMADLTDADFTGADLSGAHLEATILKNADLALANLYGAFMEDVDLTDSNWWRARGLESRQLEEFALRFSPTPNASESRQRDFQIWLSKRDDTSEN